MTDTITQPTPPDAVDGAARRSFLTVAMRADRPHTLPLRVCLDDHDELRIVRGRALGSALVAPRVRELQVDDPSMSSTHFRLRRIDGAWWLEDAPSRNGTAVDGVRVARGALRDGAVIEAGQSFFVFRTCETEASSELAIAAAIARPRGLVTLHPGLDDQLASLIRIAPAPLAVLIRGETGTGKELVARAIHEVSRRPGALVAVNCAAIPLDLLHAELCGARRGAYSGATSDRLGFVRAAEGGTLFLDEIAELAPGAQVTLLRILEERAVVPLGATQPVPVDVRFLSATHADVHAIGFRPDLLGRLAGFVIALPALRDRREDLGLLVASFLDDCGAPPDVSFALAAARRLMHGAWRLNIRQLRNSVTAAVLTGDRRIEAAHLPVDELPVAGADRASPSRPGQRSTITAEQLASLLRAHAGNISAVARALATSRTHVTRLMRRLGVDPSGNASST